MHYDTHIFCCINERADKHVRGCCKAKDAVKLHNYMKVRIKELGIENIRVNKSGCLDRCELGAVMVLYPEGIWYHYKNTDDIDEIINSHVVNGKQVERLLLDDNQVEL